MPKVPKETRKQKQKKSDERKRERERERVRERAWQVCKLLRKRICVMIVVEGLFACVGPIFSPN